MADSLAQESCQVNTPVPAGPDPIARLAGWWRDMQCSSLAMDETKQRVSEMSNLAQQGKIDGVIIAAPAFCDPEEYDYPIFHAEFEAKHIHHIYLEITDSGAAEQAVSRLQAFSEMIGQ